MGEREQMTSTLMVWVESAEAQDRMESAGKRPMRAAAKRCICGFTKKHTPGGSERVTRADSFKRLLGSAVTSAIQHSGKGGCEVFGVDEVARCFQRRKRPPAMLANRFR